MSEEGRRDLIARQHRALYGNESGNFMPQGGFADEAGPSRDSSSGAPGSSTGTGRGPSPRGMDPFGMGQPSTQASSSDQNTSTTGQESGRADSSSSPASGTAPATFNNFENSTQQTSKSSTSPTGAESPTRQVTKSTTAPIGSGMGPIGSRPAAQQQSAPNPTLNKRSTTPLASPLGYGFGSNEQNKTDERAGSSNSNTNTQKESGSNANNNNMGAWGTGSGVWGSNKIGATSVWG